MNNKFLKLFILIIYLIGFIFSVLANIYKSHNLAEVSMWLYILFGLIIILSFILKK
ncbi:MAG: hypothetical protein ACTHWZ_03560 [Peptoniphilaceae bacterium]